MNKIVKLSALRVITRDRGEIPGCSILARATHLYRGSFPSQSLCDFVNDTKEKMKYLDDGERMVYQRSHEEMRNV